MLAILELVVLEAACAEAPTLSRLMDKATTVAPRWTEWSFK
ncbi:hypothetical protein [Streptomyces caeruleatus]|nr:hypothetical protein [Streptomyces caeruleatus]